MPNSLFVSCFGYKIFHSFHLGLIRRKEKKNTNKQNYFSKKRTADFSDFFSSCKFVRMKGIYRSIHFFLTSFRKWLEKCSPSGGLYSIITFIGFPFLLFDLNSPQESPAKKFSDSFSKEFFLVL